MLSLGMSVEFCESFSLVAFFTGLVCPQFDISVQIVRPFR